MSTRKQTLIEAATVVRGLVIWSRYMMHTDSINHHLFVYQHISEGKPMSIEANYYLKNGRNCGNISGKADFFNLLHKVTYKRVPTKFRTIIRPFSVKYR